MDGGEAINTDEAMEEMKSRHSKEKKELQAKLMTLKHGLAKNDKKGKKEVSQQSEQMEKEIKQRHEKEMAELELRLLATKIVNEEKGGKAAADQSADGRTKGAADLNEHEEQSTIDKATEEGTPFFKQIKLSKAQLKKEKKRAEKANARNKAEADDAENAQNSRGNLENKTIEHLLDERALELVDIAPDGDCLYSAMAHQASVSGLGKFSAKEMRGIAADYIQKHREEFLPFLADENNATFGDAHFDDYCSKVKRMCASGGSWGGEPELRALSSALHCRVEVLCENGGTITFGEMFPRQPLIVTYHKFAYTLGEHYNSTKPF